MLLNASQESPDKVVETACYIYIYIYAYTETNTVHLKHGKSYLHEHVGSTLGKKLTPYMDLERLTLCSLLNADEHKLDIANGGSQNGGN